MRRRFILLTAGNLIFWLGLLIVGRTGTETAFGAVALAAGLAVTWFCACRGTIAGMAAVYDPTPRNAAIAVAHMGVVALFCAWVLAVSLW